MKILIVMGGFFPGQKFGGPPVSVENFCTLMDDCECYIVTRNHDMGETEPYQNIDTGWNDRGNCKVLYLSDREYKRKKYEEIIREICPDVLYLQGLFQSCIIPCLRLAKKYKIPVMLAPRGELCAGAFKKKYKKIPYITVLKIFGLLRNVHFQSTSDEETQAIQNFLSVDEKRIRFLTNIPSIPKENKLEVQKEPGVAKFVFLSRIVSKKNLSFALKCFEGIQGNVVFDIYGTIEDKNYWNKCEQIINMFPKNIKVEYKGNVVHEQVHKIFSAYDAFLFPTQSENFGHVIAEALSIGCPVIVSDQVPWTDVEAFGAGWSIPLNDMCKYREVIQKILSINTEEKKHMSQNAEQYFSLKVNLPQLKHDYRVAFDNTKTADDG